MAKKDDLQLRLQTVTPENETMSMFKKRVMVEPPPEEEPITEILEPLREARRAGQYFQGRKYRTRLAKLVNTWRARNTPEFFVAAQELEDALLALRNDDPPADA